MLNENQKKSIVTLEQNLRQTRNEQQTLIAKRQEIRSVNKDSTNDEERITREIEALEKAAKQNEAEIYDFLAMLRKNKI
jgi:GTP-dependent phosphoenolpyruvate carboxykinase